MFPLVLFCKILRSSARKRRTELWQTFCLWYFAKNNRYYIFQRKSIVKTVDTFEWNFWYRFLLILVMNMPDEFHRNCWSRRPYNWEVAENLACVLPPPLPHSPQEKSEKGACDSPSCIEIILHKLKKNSFRRPKFPWLMFHVIPVLKMSVHATYFHRAIERVTHFFNRLTLYWARKMFFHELIEGKDPWSYESLPTGYGKLLVWNKVLTGQTRLISWR